MHQAIKDMLAPYHCKTPQEYKNALKEIVQEIALLGLSRQGFLTRPLSTAGRLEDRPQARPLWKI